MTRPHGRPARYLVVHPGAELFGSDRMALESVRGMLADGADVLVALPETGPLADALADSGARVVIVPMLVLRKSLLHPRNWARTAHHALRAAAAGRRLLRSQRPDAVYVSTVTLPQWPLLAAARRIPVVAHVHEAEASASRLINTALYLPLVTTRRVLVNSAFTRDTMRGALPRATRRAQVVYNGVSGPAATTSPRRELDELRVLYIGRLSPRKGVDVLLDGAAALHRDGHRIRVALLGSAFRGYEWYEDDLRDRARHPPAAPTEFLGFRSEIWPVLADYDVLVVPSRLDEPFGNTAVEGILARRPVIASDTSGLREAAGGYDTTTLVDPDDPDALAAALVDVADRWATLRDRVEDAGRRAETRHDPRAYRAQVARAMSGAVGR